MGEQIFKGIIDGLHGLAAILDWIKILNNVFSETAYPIEAKFTKYHQTMNLHTVWKWWHQRSRGVADILDRKNNLIRSKRNFTNEILHQNFGQIPNYQFHRSRGLAAMLVWKLKIKKSFLSKNCVTWSKGSESQLQNFALITTAVSKI